MAFVIQTIFRKSVLSFIAIAFALTALAAETVRDLMGEGGALPGTIMALITLAALTGYFVLIHKYLTRRESLFRARREGEWRQRLLETGPGGIIVEYGNSFWATQHVYNWVGQKIKSAADIAPLLIERDREIYAVAVRELKDGKQDFTLNISIAATGTPLRVHGRFIDGLGYVIWMRDRITDHKLESGWQTDRANYESEITKLFTVANTVPRPVWLRRITGQIVWCNATYATAMEASRERVIEQQIEFAAKSQYKSARDLARKAVEADAVQSEERHVVVDSGSRKLFRIIETPVMLEGYIVGIAFDQTELEEAREEVQQHQESFEQTLEQLATPMAIFGSDQRLRFSNNAYMRLWHFSEDFLRSRPSYGDMLEDLRSRRKIPEVVDFQRFKRERNAYFTSLLEPHEEMMHLPDGTTVRQVVIPHPHGGLMFVTEDVTDKLALESSYNTLIAVQRETLDNLAEGIAVLGSDGRLKLSNPAFARIWQLDEAALEVSPHIVEVLEQMRPLLEIDGDWASRRQRVVAEMLHREPATRRIQRANRSIVEHISVPLPDGNVLHSFVDVSDSVRVEQALRETNRALAAADKLKSEFVANVSYQLRTPLSTIIGFAEILTNQYFGGLNDRQMDYAKTILEASRKLLALINTVLDLATIEAGRMLLNRKPVEVNKLLSGAIGMVDEWAKRQQITIDMNGVAENETFEIDERRIQQVMYNLLTNAVQYTPPGGRIVVSANRHEDTMIIAVKDNGIGMSDDEQKRVFNKFERANPQARQPGVGLGLSLVKSLVELHGGHITLESEINEGTAITCYLPVKMPRHFGEEVA